MPENSEAKEAVTLGSVAVAATLESSTLSDDASSESALVASPVVEFLPASEMYEDAALDIWDCTEDTTLEMVFAVPVAEARASVFAGNPKVGRVVEVVLLIFAGVLDPSGLGRRPPKMPSSLESASGEVEVALAEVLTRGGTVPRGVTTAATAEFDRIVSTPTMMGGSRVREDALAVVTLATSLLRDVAGTIT